MRARSILIIWLLISLSLLAQTETRIRNEIKAANDELIEIYGFQVRYNLTILTGQGHEQPAAIDDDGMYQIFLYTSNFRDGVARHELAHVYFFEHLRKKGSSPETIPLWYHELIAEGFQNLHSRAGRPPLRSGFFDFTTSTNNYPPEKDRAIFYSAVESFAGFLLSRFDYKSLLYLVDEFSSSGDMNSSFKAIFGSSLDSLIAKWRVFFLLPYSPFLIGVVIFLYLLIGRRERYWRQFHLNPENLKKGEDGEIGQKL
jgi:hypothetical protein